MNFDNKKIVPRFVLVIALMTLGGVYILGNAAYKMVAEREFWQEVSEKLVKEDLPLPAKRGNILSADGQLMASTLPEYKIYMDFVAYDRNPKVEAQAQAWRDSVLFTQLDSICEGLEAIFPDKDAAYFRKRLRQGHQLRRRNWQVYPGRISYIQYRECLTLPLFRERPFKGGFYAEEMNLRKKPYGSLATRTLGALYAQKDSARFGLELSYDSILRGQVGVSHRMKVRNKWLNVVDIPPVDGHDIETTIDVSMQDAAEKALVKQLKAINADVGVAVLMEVATGDVKAIVNMTKTSDGEYYELKNNAVADLMEPGSTFKTASIMVALEEGKITKYDSVQTGNGQWPMYGRVMKDHNWRKGGYGTLTVPEILMFSSNIGVSRIIDDHYKKAPEKFVDALYRMGVGIPLEIPLPGSGEPRVRRPKADWSNWWKTALPWMSIGYETQIPPIATLTFYNAIANDGKMVRPRFVRAELQNGEVVREFPVEVIREQICSQKTLDDIQEILELVVSKGLGKKAGSKHFKVAGKTGTAQVAQGAGGYHGGRMKYLISFCGYFPAEAPKYSCIVAIQKSGLPASGGGHCGPVFSEIAQHVMAKGVYREVEEAADSTSVFVPEVLHGNLQATRNVLEALDIPVKELHEDAEWCNADMEGASVVLEGKDWGHDVVPDVRGMGARDAVYLLEDRGLKVQISGVGQVVSQSIRAGVKASGQSITIRLR